MVGDGKVCAEAFTEVNVANKDVTISSAFERNFFIINGNKLGKKQGVKTNQQMQML